jgi:polygalacturonase
VKTACINPSLRYTVPMNATEIAQMIANSPAGFYGLRADARAFEVGDSVPTSYVWDFANDCSSNVLADGASTIGISFAGELDAEDVEDAEKVQAALDKASRYGGTVYLVAGRHAGYGDADDGEVLIDGAVVVAVL